MGGYLDLFGIREWFYSLPKEDQEKIVKYYSQGGMNTNPDDLFNIQILRIIMLHMVEVFILNLNIMKCLV